MRLYDNPISGNCYKVRLFLALIGLPYATTEVDSLHGGTRTPEFLALSPRGLIPVLEEEGEVIADSMAILLYLARRHAPQWLPADPLGEARVAEWLAVAADELQYGAASARRILKLGVAGNIDAAQALTRKGLALLEGRLQHHPWLAGEAPTIADIACYPYTALAPEGGLDLAPYPAVAAWLQRIRALPGYHPMPGIEG